MPILSRLALVVLMMVSFAFASTALADGPRYRIEVAGLACPFCAYGIEKKLNALDGVERLETNIGEGIVIIFMQEGASLEATIVERAVRDAGFTLDGFEQITQGERG